MHPTLQTLPASGCLACRTPARSHPCRQCSFLHLDAAFCLATGPLQCSPVLLQPAETNPCTADAPVLPCGHAVLHAELRPKPFRDRRNLAALRAFSKNWLPLLFNAYLATPSGQLAPLEAAISALAAVAEPAAVANFFRTVIQKLIKVQYGPCTSQPVYFRLMTRPEGSHLQRTPSCWLPACADGEQIGIQSQFSWPVVHCKNPEQTAGLLWQVTKDAKAELPPSDPITEGGDSPAERRCTFMNLALALLPGLDDRALGVLCTAALPALQV